MLLTAVLNLKLLPTAVFKLELLPTAVLKLELLFTAALQLELLLTAVLHKHLSPLQHSSKFSCHLQAKCIHTSVTCSRIVFTTVSFCSCISPMAVKLPAVYCRLLEMASSKLAAKYRVAITYY